jgi:hypothetical protein
MLSCALVSDINILSGATLDGKLDVRADASRLWETTVKLYLE